MSNGTRIHLVGDFGPAHVNVTWRAPGRVVVPDVERAIEMAWLVAMRRPGVNLFDGPMCRLERWNIADGVLSLEVSRTSYRAFLGTNLINAQLAGRYGDGILANGLGVSSALVSSDGELMFGVRSDRVAYYPGRVHPFAGSLEVKEPLDVFDEVLRELNEELNLRRADITRLRCIGLCEDMSIRQPELIFAVDANRSRAEIERLVDEEEHTQVWTVPASREGIEHALATPALTPVARGAAALWGRAHFGDEWFNGVQSRLDGA